MLADSDHDETIKDFSNIEKKDSLIEVGQIVTVEQEQTIKSQKDTAKNSFIDRAAQRKDKINKLLNKKY